MLDKRSKRKLYDCIENIVKWYLSDTLILLDCVLTDDYLNPEYSADTTYSRLENIIIFERLYYDQKYTDISDYLQKNGYTKDDVDSLNQRRMKELEDR